ncbi:response regulator [Parvularcula marina]|uniref:response regulator n=1 Tax=Parvularcula marina TaxID=2292771 RepID=UPI003511A346
MAMPLSLNQPSSAAPFEPGALPVTDSLEILMIEDSSATSELLLLFLRHHGHHVLAAMDGEDGLGFLLSKRYDVLLLDFHLPKMNGVEVLLEYKRQRGTNDMPLLIGMTGDIEGLMAHAESSQHFDRILGKPFYPQQLISILGSARPNRKMQGFAQVEANAPFTVNTISDLPEPTNDSDRRKSDRIPVTNAPTKITLTTGETHHCMIKDVSMGAAALEVSVKPEIGERVTVGRTSACVIRHTNDGIVVQWIQ